MLKALPLLIPLFGILRGKVYTYQWTALLVLAYFTEGVVRAWSDRGVSQQLAFGRDRAVHAAARELRALRAPVAAIALSLHPAL